MTTFNKTTAKFTVEVNLDPIPGTCHDAEDWEQWLNGVLNELVGHYHPVVHAVAKTSTNHFIERHHDEYEVEDILGFWYISELCKLPIVSDTCEACGKRALINDEDVHCSRINGDSKWGYATYHNACLKIYEKDEPICCDGEFGAPFGGHNFTCDNAVIPDEDEEEERFELFPCGGCSIYYKVPTWRYGESVWCPTCGTTLDPLGRPADRDWKVVDYPFSPKLQGPALLASLPGYVPWNDIVG